MNTNPLKQGALIEHSAGLGTVTRKMVRARAVELARINGRLPQQMSKEDLAQAKRELTGKSEADPQIAPLDAAPESERWDAVPGSVGHKAPVTASEDEDDEGRSDQENLVQEGMAEANHDQMLRATKIDPDQ